MVYRDERAELRARLEALADEVAELRRSVERLEVAAAAGALRGLSEDAALELSQLAERVALLESGAAPAPRRRRDAPVPSDPKTIRALVDEEATLTGRKPQRGRR
jgi:hypothetical protein